MFVEAEQLIAYGLAMQIEDIVRNKTHVGNFGILVTSLTHFEKQELITRISDLRKTGLGLRLAIADDQPNLTEFAYEQGFDEQTFDTSLLTAGTWRNTQGIEDVPIAVAHGEQPTLHTLAAFTRISSADIAVRLLRWAAADQNVAVNGQQMQLFQSLEDEDFKELHNPFNIATYLIKLLQLKENDRLEGIREYLPYLGLLKDPEIFSVGGGIKARIKENLKYCNYIRYFPPATQKKVSSRLDEFEDNHIRQKLKNTLKTIESYQRKFSPGDFWNLTLKDVIDLILLKPERQKRNEPTSGDIGTTTIPNDEKFTQEDLHKSFAESLLDRNYSARAKISDALREALDAIDNNEASSNINVSDEEAEYTTRIKIDRKLLDFIKVFCSKHIWGGTFTSEHGTLKKAIDHYQYNEADGFSPDDIAFVKNNLTLRKLIEDLNDSLPQRNLKSTFDRFEELRIHLLQYIEGIVIAPLETIGASDEVYQQFRNYVDSYAELLSILQNNYGVLSSESGIASRIAVARILAFDVVLVRTTANELHSNKAILMPLHPLHLWKYIQLVKIYLDENIEVENADRNAILAEATTNRHFLHTLFVSSIFSDDQQPIALPFAGTIETLPCYENTTNHYSGSDGIDRLFYTLNRFIAFYPLFARPLRITIVDIPSISDLLSEIGKFLNSNDRNKLHGLEVSLFFTRVSESRNYLASLTDGENERVYQEFVSSGRLNIKISHEGVTLSDLVARHGLHPVHVIALFDQSELEVDDFKRQQLFIPDSPFCITREYRYDKYVDDFEINPVNDAPLFSDYNKLVNQFRNTLLSFNSGVVGRTKNFQSNLDDLLGSNGALWVFVADRVLPDENRLTYPRIFARRSNNREILVLANTSAHFARELELLLKNYNLYPNQKEIQNLLLDFSHMVSDGLLSIIQASDGSLMENKSVGLIGLLVAARTYQQDYPDSLIVAIDNQEARRWLRVSDVNRRADLLGLRCEDNKFIIEVVEVKTVSNDDQILSQDGNEIAGKAVEQLASTRDAILQVFQAPDSPLTPPRREALKDLFYSECQSRRYDRDFRKIWSERLQQLFSDPVTIEFESRIYRISFGDTLGSERRLLQAKLNGNVLGILYIALGEKQIQSIISGIPIESLEEALSNLNVEPVSIRKNNTMENRFAQSGKKTELSDSNSQLKSPSTETPQNETKLQGVVDNSWLEQISKNFVTACRYHDIIITSCLPEEAIVGLSIVRFPFHAKKGSERNRIIKRLDDIGRDMSVPNLGNLSVQTVENHQLVLDVPHPSPSTPFFIPHGRDALPPITSKEQLPIAIGVKPTGDTYVADLREVVHMLVAGTTGAGKTIFLYSIILSLLKNHSLASDLELVLCSAKFEDFSFFTGLPQLYGRDIITDAQDAIQIIGDIAQQELPRRSDILARHRVRSVEELNAQVGEENQLHPIIIIVDEFADLADQVGRNRAELEAFHRNIRQIAQAGRSRSVHLVLCTQRPTADLFPSNIKALMNARVVLKMNSAVDSRTILDDSGAEKLLGKGDMLFKFGGITERLQSFYVDTSDLASL